LQRERNLRSRRSVSFAVNIQIVFGAGSVASSLDRSASCAAFVGKQAILADNEKFAAEYPGFKVLRYAAKYQNIQIKDGLACEWGEHESQFRVTPEAPPISWHGTGFHVLKRQSDGSWKFAVMILNQ